MLPGYADVSVREDVLIEAQRVDSLETITQNNQRQLLIIKNIIADNIQFDSIHTIDSTNIEKWNNLPLIAGSAENEFIKQYEDENAFNVGHDDNTSKKDETIVFITPAIGTITQHFTLDNNAITIVCPANTPILAPQDGYIILSNYHPTDGYTIAIQHNDGYVSIFHQLGEKLCNIGAEVKVGEAIAFAGSKDNKKQDSQIQYELWHNGLSINPEDYIVF
jgi:lipoprotein NlpD